MEGPVAGGRSWGVRRRSEGGAGSGGRPQDPARQDRRPDAGERPPRRIRRGAHQGRGPQGQVFVRGVEGGTAERKAMIDPEHDLPIKQQAVALGISRSSVYYQPHPISAEDLWLMRRIDELHLNYPFAGSRMLRGLLWQQGLELSPHGPRPVREGPEVGRRHIKTLMKRMGIEATRCF